MPKSRKVIYHNYEKRKEGAKNIQHPIPKYQVTFTPVRYTPDNLKAFTKKIKQNLTIDLLPHQYRKQAETNKMFGYCVVVVQTLYYLFETDKLSVYKGRSKDFTKSGDWHYWLQDKKKIIDLTKSQYTSQGLKPPYDNPKQLKQMTRPINCKQAPLYWDTGWQGRMRVSTISLLERVVDCKRKDY